MHCRCRCDVKVPFPPFETRGVPRILRRGLCMTGLHPKSHTATVPHKWRTNVLKFQERTNYIRFEFRMLDGGSSLEYNGAEVERW